MTFRLSIFHISNFVFQFPNILTFQCKIRSSAPKRSQMWQIYSFSNHKNSFPGVFFLVAVLFQSKHKKWSLVHCICGFMILNYKFSYLPSITPKMSVYTGLAFMILSMLEKGTMLPPVALFCSLLHKPHNIILVPMVIITAKKMFSFCDIWTHRKRSLIYKTIFAFWISKMYFFYQVCLSLVFVFYI